MVNPTPPPASPPTPPSTDSAPPTVNSTPNPPTPQVQPAAVNPPPAPMVNPTPPPASPPTPPQASSSSIQKFSDKPSSPPQIPPPPSIGGLVNNQFKASRSSIPPGGTGSFMKAVQQETAHRTKPSNPHRSFPASDSSQIRPSQLKKFCRYPILQSQ